ncbi:hypothetical protein MKX01_021665 [Papaver californicum]|nr:hypothetical protein MKX01_021665 [Papaver californicum]
MGEIDEISVMGLQDSHVEGESKARTLLEFLKEEEENMDSVNQTSNGRWKNLKNRFGFGAIWSISSQAPNLMNVREEEEEENDDEMSVGQIPVSAENSILVPNQSFCVSQNPVEFTGLNLAAASGPPVTTTSIRSPPLRVSLMRLLRQGDGEDVEKARDRLGGGGGSAAFIPCGHTFCRVCSRDIWLNRGSCAICNRSIVEILDIF